MVRFSLRRQLVAVVSGVLAIGAFVTPAAAASQPTFNRADAAAGWLARQMVDGDHFEAEFGGFVFPDQGLTIDAIFAFASAKTADNFGAAATTWLAQPDILTGYIGDGVLESYAGPTAKVALAAEVRGIDPAGFGGVDLITRLRGLQQPSGRFSDRSAFGDFSNAFSQSLAILALDRTAPGAPAAAVSFLAGTRCPNGGYPLFFGQASCISDVDSTAMAVQALLAAEDIADAIPGLQWLVSVQRADGGFVNSGGTPNANSTGLAGQAFRAAALVIPAARARQFLVDLQVGCAGAPADRGAVAFTAGGLDPANAARATAQAVLGMADGGFPHLTAAGSQSGDRVLACP